MFVIQKVYRQLSSEGLFVGTGKDCGISQYSCVHGSKKTGKLRLHGSKMCPVPDIIGAGSTKPNKRERKKIAEQLTQGIDCLEF